MDRTHRYKKPSRKIKRFMLLFATIFVSTQGSKIEFHVPAQISHEIFLLIFEDPEL